MLFGLDVKRKEQKYQQSCENHYFENWLTDLEKQQSVHFATFTFEGHAIQNAIISLIRVREK